MQYAMTEESQKDAIYAFNCKGAFKSAVASISPYYWRTMQGLFKILPQSRLAVCPPSEDDVNHPSHVELLKVMYFSQHDHLVALKPGQPHPTYSWTHGILGQSQLRSTKYKTEAIVSPRFFGTICSTGFKINF